ncbi:MAG: penicillin-binding protein 1C [Saprospiraceae bacterium]|nr:penicillin-binding protein 1C [Saprospiraceae bacterium]
MVWFKYGTYSLFIAILFAIFSTYFIFQKEAYSYVALDSKEEVLISKIAKDGQWRFPISNVPDSNYIASLLEFEDKRFFYHLGVDPLAILRAIKQNIAKSRVVSGGSTITMQLSRMVLKHKTRSIFAKLSEMIVAIGLEFRFSKSQILKLYSIYASYGGNIVGIGTAKWKYFNKYNIQLSFAEAATLAVLPHQPSLIHTSKNNDRLLHKRNSLLLRLKKSNFISDLDYKLAILEPLPIQKNNLSRASTHALDYLIKTYPDRYIFHTTIDPQILRMASQILYLNHNQFKENLISNAACLVVENSSQKVLAYIGNILDSTNRNDAFVDMIHAPRSSGSILKPLLISSMIDKGLISDASIVADIPIQINGFIPENFDRSFSGYASVRNILKHSLNVPSVKLLQQYGVEPFYRDLKSLGFNTLFRNAEDYGLSLILGGAEITIWDLATVYSNLANIHQTNFNSVVDHKNSVLQQLKMTKEDSLSIKETKLLNLSIASIGKMFSLMRNPYSFSPGEIEHHNSNIAWKTGTSFGFKDAWCITISPKYTVVVWVGNSSGLSRPGIIGLHTAAPIAHAIMERLNDNSVWLESFNLMKPMLLCRESGFLASEFCNEVDTTLQCPSASHLEICKYHKLLAVDSNGTYQVNRFCENNFKLQSYFILPPIMEFYYKTHHSNYISAPQLRKDCLDEGQLQSDNVDIIYPTHLSIIKITKDIDAEENQLIFKAVQKRESALESCSLHWFIDSDYLGVTCNDHTMKCKPNVGKHKLLVTNDFGESKTISFEILK